MASLSRPSAAHHVDGSLAAGFRRNLVGLRAATRTRRLHVGISRDRIGGLLVGRDSRGVIIAAVAIVSDAVAIVSVRHSPTRRETPAATEMPIVAEAAARLGKVLTRKAAAESPARTAEMADPTAHVSAAEAAAHMSATTETSAVSTTTTTAARKRISGQP